jgi:fructose-1,6-bisphosphatase/inositol monophosphatase family enzyme
MGTERSPNRPRTPTGDVGVGRVTEISDIDAAVRATAASIVLPHYRRGRPNAPIDQVVERELSERLQAILPDSTVIGEESWATTSTSVCGIRARAGSLWLVDPIDGSHNFLEGNGPFVMMVALLVDGGTRLALIHDPLAGTSASAVAGNGATIAGRAASVDRSISATSELTGLVPLQYLPKALNTRVRRGLGEIGKARSGHRCVGREYLDLLDGSQDFAMFWNIQPWDHAPGQLLAQESGLVSHCFDGSPFRDPFTDQRGLIVARTETVSEQVRSVLLD